ncbi:hypothetical protein HDV62DRAFT_62524 [Trichoderma sp. SZMC 28011]
MMWIKHCQIVLSFVGGLSEASSRHDRGETWAMWRAKEVREGVQQRRRPSKRNGTIAESSLVMSGQIASVCECDGLLQMAERAESHPILSGLT